MARPFLPVYTFQELADICRNADLTAARKSGLAHYREPFSERLAGLTLPCRFNNGVRLTLRFRDAHTLEWSENGGEPREEYYEALDSSAGNVIGVHFFRRHVLPFEGAFFVFDLDTGYVTWVTMPIGVSTNDKDVHPFPHFGEIEGFGNREGQRHRFSNEFVGTVIDWKYDDSFSIRHAYITPYITICPETPNGIVDYEGFVHRTFLPAFHVKIRDQLLLTSFVEKGGCAAALLIDLKLVHDIGCFYGITHEGRLSSVTLAALGGLAGAGIRDNLVPPLIEA
jgi:hypothetical protein